MGERLLELLLVLASQIEYSILSVKSHSNGLICLNEVVEFLCQVIVLKRQYSDMVVQSIDLRLKVGIVIK